MLLPKRTKFRKPQKGRNKNTATRGAEIAFGVFGLKTLEYCKITNKQIESARVAVTRFMKREGKVWIRIFPDKAITRKEGWCAPVKPGMLLFECDGVSREVAEEAMRLAAQKLPVKTKFVVRRDAVEYSEVA